MLLYQGSFHINRAKDSTMVVEISPLNIPKHSICRQHECLCNVTAALKSFAQM